MTITTTRNKVLIAFSAVSLFIIMPGRVLGTLEWLAIGLFEALELILDTVIEHLLHTSRHTTQIIVFYLLATLAVLGAYRLFRAGQEGYREAKAAFPEWWSERRNRAFSYWQTLPFGKRIMLSGCTASAACLVIIIL